MCWEAAARMIGTIHEGQLKPDFVISLDLNLIITEKKKLPPFPLIPPSSQDSRTCDELCPKSLALISLLFLCGPACKFSQQRASWELVKTVTWGKLYFTGSPKPPTHSVLHCTHIQHFHPSVTALQSDLHEDRQTCGGYHSFGSAHSAGAKNAKDRERWGNQFSVVVYGAVLTSVVRPKLLIIFLFFFFISLFAYLKSMKIIIVFTCK